MLIPATRKCCEPSFYLRDEGDEIKICKRANQKPRTSVDELEPITVLTNGVRRTFMRCPQQTNNTFRCQFRLLNIPRVGQLRETSTSRELTSIIENGLANKG
ncbi:hypothetical protein GALMADRAFT_1312477 [Galerina marginata CBS 339.88]|uniref:Uncharacterized protein n=1 Tax=Galerina marginata (strain CBS 339.88) TaxID=685588 RepID=A0A067TEI0_GALM3|nr:hypothetical protein GALMADRAFT_1312477 [Galerina marginata CBS 339.88]